MKHMDEVKKFYGGLWEKAREALQYVVPTGAGAAGALMVVPRGVDGGWSLFSFSTEGLVTSMMGTAESIFNGLIGAFGPIWGIYFGVGLIVLIGAVITGIMFKKKSS
jgi:hypothetical protein